MEDVAEHGDLEGRGSKFSFKDKPAKKLGGVGLFRVWPYSVLDSWRYKIKAFGDLSESNDGDPLITVTILFGPHTFVHTDTWTPLKKG